MRLLTRSEAAAELRIGLSTLDRLVASGALPVVYLGPRSPRIRAIDLDDYLTRLRGEEAPLDVIDLRAALRAATPRGPRRGRRTKKRPASVAS